MRVLVPSLVVAGLVVGPRAAVAAPANSCVFTVSMTSGVDVNNLDFVVDYPAADGFIGGTATRPECARALSGRAFAAFHDDVVAKQLAVSMVRLDYFSAPVPLIGCRFYYDSLEPIPSDFSVVLTNSGRDGEDGNVIPEPTLTVSKVECPGDLPEPTTTTTTLDTTTTTMVGSGACGFPVTGGAKPAASDALFALKAAVGLASCDLCVCDLNGGGSIAASDALGILRAAVGLEVAFDCPPC